MGRISIVTYIIVTGLGILLNFNSCVSEMKTSEGNNVADQKSIYLAEIVSGIYTNEAVNVENLMVYRGSRPEDTIHLSQLAVNNILILRFSDDACNICIDFALNMVKKVFPDYQQNERIVYLVSQIPERLKDKYYGKPVYSFIGDELNLPFEKYHIPYFMMLDQSMECKLFFIPEMSQPRLTEFYLSTVKERYFSD